MGVAITTSLGLKINNVLKQKQKQTKNNNKQKTETKRHDELKRQKHPLKGKIFQILGPRKSYLRSNCLLPNWVCKPKH